MDTPVIETTALRKRYASGEAGVDALRGIDLVVRSGEFVAIMGPSGSGKSTLLSILGCLERPTEGSYRLTGEEVGGFDLPDPDGPMMATNSPERTTRSMPRSASTPASPEA